MQSTRYICPITMKFNFFFRLIFEKQSISNFMNIRPVEAELFHADRRTDRHAEANSRFSLLSDSAYKEDRNRIHKPYLPLDGFVVIQIC